MGAGKGQQIIVRPREIHTRTHQPFHIYFLFSLVYKLNMTTDRVKIPENCIVKAYLCLETFIFQSNTQSLRLILPFCIYRRKAFQSRLPVDDLIPFIKKSCNSAPVLCLDDVRRASEISLVHIRIFLRKRIQRKSLILRIRIGAEPPVEEKWLCTSSILVYVSAEIPVHQILVFFHTENVTDASIIYRKNITVLTDLHIRYVPLSLLFHFILCIRFFKG